MQSNITLSYSAPFEAKTVKSEIDRLRAEATRIKIDADAFPKTSITKLNELALEFTKCEEPTTAARTIGELERKRSSIQSTQLNKELYESYWEGLDVPDQRSTSNIVKTTPWFYERTQT